MRCNGAGIGLLKYWESCRLAAYWDVTGWACGWGTHGADVVEGTVWTQAEADRQLEEFIAAQEIDLGRLVQVNLTSNQWSALVCFTYNIGLGMAFRHSHFLAALNVQDWDEVRVIWPTWSKVNGVESLKLKQRRQSELGLFFTL